MASSFALASFSALSFFLNSYSSFFLFASSSLAYLAAFLFS
jgi:hypothetical protein